MAAKKTPPLPAVPHIPASQTSPSELTIRAAHSAPLFPSSADIEAAMAETTLGAIHGEPVNLTFDGDILSWTKVYELPGGKGIPSKGSFTSSNILTLVKTPGADVQYTIYSTSNPEDSDPSAAVPDVKLVVTNVNNPPADFIARHLFQGLPQYLRLIPEDIHIIISSRSGVGKADSFFEVVVKPLLEGAGLEGSHYQVLETQSSESVYDFGSKKLKEKACRSVKQTIILLSGDGGVSDLLNGLGGAERMSTYVRPTIITFPLGTGNALFHSIHKNSPPSPSPLHTGLLSLLSGSPHPLPHFIAEFSNASLILPSSSHPQPEIPLRNPHIYGAIVASYGFHSTLVADSDTPELRKYGDKRFQMIAADLLKEPHKYKACVRITHRLSDKELSKTEAQVQSSHGTVCPIKEEKIQRRHHSYILCTLVSNLEKTFTISPASRPLDGKLRVVDFDSDSGKEIMDIMAAAYQGGKHVDLPIVGYQEVEAVKIDFEEEKGEWLRVCIDGAIVRVEERGWMRISNGQKGENVFDVVV